MKIGERTASFIFCALSLALLESLPMPAEAKSPVTFTSPCECIGNHGVSRWAAKTDLQEPPTNTVDIKSVTPSQMLAWPGPGGRITQRSERTAAENRWYAATGRIEKVKTEDDGDIHIELKDVSSDATVVVEIPLGPRWCQLRKTVFSWTNATFPLGGRLSLTQHPIVTVIGKAFYDIDHSGNDTVTNRRNYDASLGVWEIHPVMSLVVNENNSAPARRTSSREEVTSAPTAPPTQPAAPIPQPTAPNEQFVTLTKPVPVQVPYGSTVLQPGTKLQVLSRDQQTVDVRYLDARYTIPISATDLKMAP
jgi:hypothetical protein